MTRLDGWHVWQSFHDDDTPAAWWASRTRTLTRQENAAGLYPTVSADTETQLRQALAQQVHAEAAYQVRMGVA